MVLGGCRSFLLLVTTIPDCTLIKAFGFFTSMLLGLGKNTKNAIHNASIERPVLGKIGPSVLRNVRGLRPKLLFPKRTYLRVKDIY